MGNESTIRTGTTNKSTKKGVSTTSTSISNLAPSSVYQFGVVTAVNPTTKEIIYNALEDNVASQKLGRALPLYKNKIQLPGIGYIVPLLRGPNVDVGPISNQYGKTTYYKDPIGIWQTVDENKVERTTDVSPESSDIKVGKIDIKKTEIGIPNNSPVLEQTTVNAAQRPLPSPPPSVAVTSSPITPLPSPSVPAAPTPNYTFVIKLVNNEWVSEIYYNNILIHTELWPYWVGEKNIRERLVYEAKHFGFFKNNQAYPKQPNIV